MFPNSRLAVRHVGEMLLGGASRDEVREDYPYLEALDLDFAVRFALERQRESVAKRIPRSPRIETRSGVNCAS